MILNQVATENVVEGVVKTATKADAMSLWDLALKGGWIMAVLVLLLILAIYIAIERYLALRNAMKAASDNQFMANIRQYIHEDNIDGAKSLANRHRLLSDAWSIRDFPVLDVRCPTFRLPSKTKVRWRWHASRKAFLWSPLWLHSDR